MKLLKEYWLVVFVAFGVLLFIKPVLCFSLLGLIIVFMGIETSILVKKIQEKGIECHGRIVEYESDGDGGRRPIVEFTSKKGEYIRETPLVYSSITDVLDSWKKIERPVLILYDEDEPERLLSRLQRLIAVD